MKYRRWYSIYGNWDSMRCYGFSLSLYLFSYTRVCAVVLWLFRLSTCCFCLFVFRYRIYRWSFTFAVILKEWRLRVYFAMQIFWCDYLLLNTPFSIPAMEKFMKLYNYIGFLLFYYLQNGSIHMKNTNRCVFCEKKNSQVIKMSDNSNVFSLFLWFL